MNLSASWIELNDALKNMRILWEETKSGWKDAVSQEFDERYWTPLDNQVVATLRAMDRLAPILARAQRECS